MDQSKGAGEPSSDQSERPGSTAQGAEAGNSPLPPQEAGPEDLRGHPASGGPALGAGPVPPARLGRLLLLHLEGRQVHGQGLCQTAPAPHLRGPPALAGDLSPHGFKLFLVKDGRE